jgi:two-component system NarL family response regulator
MVANNSNQLKIPSVIIADDHELFRKALVLTLEDAGMNIIETVSSGQHAIEVTINHKPDILILDVVMPELDGLAALSTIKYLVPETRVIVISSIAEPEYLSRAGELGADAFFSKGVSSELLIGTIKSLASGDDVDFHFEETSEPSKPTIPCIHVSSQNSSETISHDLTNQEIVVLSLIALGHDTRSILDQLCISNNTLKTHLRNVYTKIGVSDRTQAAVWAIKNGIGENFSISSP